MPQWEDLLDDDPFDTFEESIDTFDDFDKFNDNFNDKFEVVKVNHDIDIKTNYKNCTDCDIECVIEGNTMVCPQCGIEKATDADNNNNYSSSYSTNHNTSDNSFISFKFTGKGSNMYHKSFLKTCANYSKYSNNNTARELENLVYQYEGNKIPKDVIALSAEMFNEIRSTGKVFRGDSKKGVVVACVYYACRIKKITKTPRYLCSLTRTPDKYLSQGERILQDLIERNVISIPTLGDPKLDYVSQYFEALKIPSIYEPFVLDLLKRSQHKSLHIIRDSRDTTKCAGTVYMLCQRVRELHHITKDDIEQKCGVSFTTFNRYFCLLMDNHIKLKKVFVRHKIPMPNYWRTTQVVKVKKKSKPGRPKKIKLIY